MECDLAEKTELYTRPPQQLTPEQWNQLLNMAGRQRMLSQRIILHVLLAEQGRREARQVALQALTLFENSYDTLSRGCEALPMPAVDTLIETFHADAGVDATMRQFVAQVRDVLIGGVDSVSLVSQATSILECLQALTALYERLAGEAAQVRRQETRALVQRIERVARESRVISLNARVVAARAGDVGREFAVVAEVLSGISVEVERLVRQAVTMN